MSEDETPTQPGGMKRSYSLAEVTAAHLPEDWTDGERWLRRRLNSGELTGFRVGRVWRMTDSDIEHLLSRGRKAQPLAVRGPAEVSDSSEGLSFWEGLSEGSRRRIKGVARGATSVME